MVRDVNAAWRRQRTAVVAPYEKLTSRHLGVADILQPQVSRRCAQSPTDRRIQNHRHRMSVASAKVDDRVIIPAPQGRGRRGSYPQLSCRAVLLLDVEPGTGERPCFG